MAFDQVVTFELSGGEYGVDITSVNGIVKSKNYKVFKIPNAPEYLEGIIHLRGKVNPVFNLKKKFKLDDEVRNDEGRNDDSKIIIINNSTSTVGFLVDEVTDIFRLKDEDIEPVPSAIDYIGTGYMLGIGKVEGKMIIILDLIKTLSVNELVEMQSISNMDLSQ